MATAIKVTASELTQDFPGEDYLRHLTERLLAHGATDAVASVSANRAVGVTVRHGEFQDVGHNEGTSLSLKAFAGTRSASVSTNKLAPDVIETMIDRVVRMAGLASEDPHGGLPPAELLVQGDAGPDLELADPAEPVLRDMEREALELEKVALDFEGVEASQGASVSHSSGRTRVVATNGLHLFGEGTLWNAGVSLIAARDGRRELGGFSCGARWRSDVMPLDAIGRRAAIQATEKLGARKIESQDAPVIFERRTAFSLVGALLGAINGGNIYHKQTFLPDPVGKPLVADGFELRSDPFRKRGHASTWQDGDGMKPYEGAIVRNGAVQTLLVSYYDSKRLGTAPTGHSGGTGNLTVAAGVLDLQGLMQKAGAGLIVTGIMGSSSNAYTGDFSMGVSGLWFEGGEIAYPVSEITIAGNFRDVFGSLVAGSDLELLGANNSPSLFAGTLAISGK